MKLNVRLPSHDVEFLDAYARQLGLDSRSAAVHRAVALLRAAELGPAYEAGWQEWADSWDAEAWESQTLYTLTNREVNLR